MNNDFTPEPREGDVVFVHALAKFHCDRCGEWCNRLTIAAVLPNGTVGKAEKPSGGEIVCNACTKKERDAEELKYEQSKERRAWARKMAPMSIRPKPKGRA